jgi:hypothetical protein
MQYSLLPDKSRGETRFQGKIYATVGNTGLFRQKKAPVGVRGGAEFTEFVRKSARSAGASLLQQQEPWCLEK